MSPLLIGRDLFSKKSKRDQVIVFVLGTRTTKAVVLRKAGGAYELLNYTLQPAPVYENGLSREVLTEHLQKILGSLDAKTNRAILVLGMGDSLIRHIELPSSNRSEMRKMIKLSPKTFLQQDLSDHVFDCHILTPQGRRTITDDKTIIKYNGLVGGAKNQVIADLEASARQAGLYPEQITLSQIALINAAFTAMPDVFPQHVIALVDLGFITSTISILINGELTLTRVVGIGGDKLTSGLAEAMNINYPAAEAVKVTMPDKVHAKLQMVVSNLGHELRASIDFFEHVYEAHVQQVFVSGGSAKSDLILQILEKEIRISCKRWDPSAPLKHRLPADRARELPKELPQLAVAIGAGVGYFNPDLPRLNLLAEKFEAEQERRRDPVRRGIWVASFLVALLLIYAGVLQFNIWRTAAKMGQVKAQLATVERTSQQAASLSKKAGQMERTVENLHLFASNRFLWAEPLNALQQASRDDIQLINLRIEQSTVMTPARKGSATPGQRPTPAQPAYSTEKVSLIIQAKDYGNPPASEQFIEALGALPFFRTNLAKTGAIRLRDRQPPQVDPSDPNKSFILFTIECLMADRITRDE